MRSGTAHPPTLPEIFAYATKPAATADTSLPAPRCTPAEILANRWFMHRSVRQRFAGIDNAGHEFRTGHAAGKLRATLEEIRQQAVRICEGHLMLLDERDPSATQERVLRFLDRMAEELYPAATAEQWLREAPTAWAEHEAAA